MAMTQSFPSIDSRLDSTAVPYSAAISVDEKLESFESLLRQAGHRGLDRVRACALDGVIFLRGQVTSYYLKQLAQEAVRPLAIGMRIRNELRVGK